jgi:hypothetical protein
MRRYGVHPIWLSDLLRAENDQVAGLLKQPDKQKLASHYTPEEAAILARLFADGAFIQKSEADKALVPAISRLLPKKRQAHRRERFH